jgi:hypothetical protein
MRNYKHFGDSVFVLGQDQRILDGINPPDKTIVMRFVVPQLKKIVNYQKLSEQCRNSNLHLL